jgi:phosphoribosyl-ATP pyrophosphohydrolase
MNDNILYSLEQVIAQRKNGGEEGSYTCYLFEKGIDKILKKVGEECSETIIAAKNVKAQTGSKEELAGEVADLIYHLAVMCADCDMPLKDVLSVLEERSLKTNNKKVMKTVDKNS